MSEKVIHKCIHTMKIQIKPFGKISCQGLSLSVYIYYEVSIGDKNKDG